MFTVNALAINDSIVEADERFEIRAIVDEGQTLDASAVALDGSSNQVTILDNDCKLISQELDYNC